MIQYSLVPPGCLNTTSQLAQVKSDVSSSFNNINDSYCLNAPLVALNVTPSGGILSGPGVTGNVFDPSAAGVGIHSIQYSFQAQGCNYTHEQTVFIREPETATLQFQDHPDNTICINSPITPVLHFPPGTSFRSFCIFLHVITLRRHIKWTWNRSEFIDLQSQ